MTKTIDALIQDACELDLHHQEAEQLLKWKQHLGSSLQEKDWLGFNFGYTDGAKAGAREVAQRLGQILNQAISCIEQCKDCEWVSDEIRSIDLRRYTHWTLNATICSQYVVITLFEMTIHSLFLRLKKGDLTEELEV